jgi:hypothetical protein
MNQIRPNWHVSQHGDVVTFLTNSLKFDHRQPPSR